jgi:type II secretory pathway component GspD/PulD (secretin)
MKLKNVFSTFLLMALPLLAAAQTNFPVLPVPPPGRGVQRTRTRTSPATNTVAPVVTNAPAATAESSPEAATNSAAEMLAQPAQPATSPDNPAAAALAVPAAPVAANPAPAAPAEPADITYHWTMPIEQLLDEIYAPLVDRTPLRANTGAAAVPKDALVTLYTQHPLTKSEAIEALETVMGMNGITVVPIGTKFFKVVTDTAAPQMGGNLTSNVSSMLPEAGKFITEIVQLKYADPAQVVAALQLFAKSPNSVIYIPSTESLIMRDYTENVKRMLEMVEKLDVESSLTIKSTNIPIRYALATDISAALSQLGAQGGGSVGRPSSGAGFKSSSTSTGVGGGGGMGGGTQGGAFGQSTQQGLSGGASGARSNFGSRLGAIVNGAQGGGGGAGAFSLFGQTKIIADERTNSLLVFANDEDMKTIIKIIKELDVVLAQVLIEAIILEVNLTDTKSFGFSTIQNQVTKGQFTGAGGNNVLSDSAKGFLNGTGSGTNGSAGSAASSVLPSLPGGFSYFAKYGNDFNAVLEAVAGDSRISVLSRPQIQTSHNVEAELFIGNTVPYVTGTQNYGYSSGPSSTYTQMEVGIRLRVLPLINVDGLVVMDIDQEIEQLGPSVAIPGAGNVPTTTKRDAGAKVAVKSGETIILGGFISASRSKSDSGVPWLKDIPVFGNLFKSSSSENDRTELIVLMRPTVLRTPEIAAQVATEQRDRMAGVKQAELDIRKDEDNRNAKANKTLQKQEAKKDKSAAQEPTNPPIEFHFTESNQVDLHLEDTNSESLKIRQQR